MFLHLTTGGDETASVVEMQKNRDLGFNAFKTSHNHAHKRGASLNEGRNELTQSDKEYESENVLSSQLSSGLIANAKDGKNIGSVLKENIAGMHEGLEVNITTPYFTLYGWRRMFEGIKMPDGGKIRLLLGSSPEDVDNNAWNNKNYLSREYRKTVDEKFRDSVPLKENALIGRFIEWLGEGLSGRGKYSIEVRFFEDNFLHAKTVKISGMHAEHQTHSLYMGSANITEKGLNSSEELMLRVYDKKVIKDYDFWFEQLWGKSRDYSEELINIYRRRIVFQNPEHVVLKILDAHFKNDEKIEINDFPESMWMFNTPDKKAYGFQEDAARSIIKKLEKYNGVVLADEVGLGKTIVALSVVQNYLLRGEKVLIAAPASLESTWNSGDYLLNEDLELLREGGVDFYTYGKIKPENIAHPRKYGLIVFDEAHALRNGDKIKTYENIQRILSKMSNPKMLFLTATPINNSVMDLYNLVKLYLSDGGLYFNLGYYSVSDEFKKAEYKTSSSGLDNIKQIASEVIIRRTREFVKYNKIKHGESDIKFPKLEDPNLIYYKISTNTDWHNIVEDFQHHMSPDGNTNSECRNINHDKEFKLAVHELYPYLSTSDFKKQYKQTQNVYLLRTAMLKALESSPSAFVSVCETLLESSRHRLQRVQNADKHKGGTPGLLEEPVRETQKSKLKNNIEELLTFDKYKTNEEGEISDTEFVEEDEMFIVKIRHLKIKEYIAALQSDITILDDWIKGARTVMHDDPKFIELKKFIESKNLLNKKTLIFSSSKVTANWLNDGLRKSFTREKIAVVCGDTPKKERSAILHYFSPTTFPKQTKYSAKDEEFEDEYGRIKILITTDILAEGVNLQECNEIINYDLPWNPMRIIQRIGRADRIGSKHDSIFVNNIVEDGTIEHFSLYKTLKRKMFIAQQIIGHTDPTGLLGNASDSHMADLEADLLEAFKEYKNDKNKLKQEVNKIFAFHKIKGENVEAFIEKYENVDTEVDKLERSFNDYKHFIDMEEKETSTSIEPHLIKKWYESKMSNKETLKEVTNVGLSSGTLVAGKTDGWLFTIKILEGGNSIIKTFFFDGEKIITNDLWESIDYTNILKETRHGEIEALDKPEEDAFGETSINSLEAWSSASELFIANWKSQGKSEGENKTRRRSVRLSEENRKEMRRLVAGKRKEKDPKGSLIYEVSNNDFKHHQVKEIENILSENYHADKKINNLYRLMLNNSIMPNKFEAISITKDDLQVVNWVRVLKDDKYIEETSEDNKVELETSEPTSKKELILLDESFKNREAKSYGESENENVIQSGMVRTNDHSIFADIEVEIPFSEEINVKTTPRRSKDGDGAKQNYKLINKYGHQKILKYLQDTNALDGRLKINMELLSGQKYTIKINSETGDIIRDGEVQLSLHSLTIKLTKEAEKLTEEERQKYFHQINNAVWKLWFPKSKNYIGEKSMHDYIMEIKEKDFTEWNKKQNIGASDKYRSTPN